MDPRALHDASAPDPLAAAHARTVEVVAELERALAAGATSAALARLADTVPDALLEPYRRIADRPELAADPRRAPAVERLLARLERDLVRVDVRFPARVERLARRNGTARPGVVASSGRGEVWLRLDQASASRRWGIAFDVADVAQRTGFERYLVARAVSGFAASLIGLGKVQQRLLGRELDGSLSYVPPEDGADFEQLLLDVLNEHAAVARHAPLHEDFFEKTDLRLRLAELGRRRGARIQVTRAVAPVHHAAKVERIRHAEEVVILSPLALARLVHDGRARQLLGADAYARLLPLLPGPNAGEYETARSLRDLFAAAISRRLAGPRGPLVAVPEALRQLVQLHAAAEARRTTAALRARLAVRGGRGAAPERNGTASAEREGEGDALP